MADHYAQVCEHVRRALLGRRWSAEPEQGRVLCGVTVEEGGRVRLHVTRPLRLPWSDYPGWWTLLRHAVDDVSLSAVELFECGLAPRWREAGDVVPLQPGTVDVLVGFVGDEDAVVRVAVLLDGDGGDRQVASWDVRVRGDGTPALAYHSWTFLPLLCMATMKTRCTLVSGRAPPRLLGLQLPSAPRAHVRRCVFCPVSGLFHHSPTKQLPDLQGVVYSTLPQRAAMELAKERMLALQRELMAAAWHPRRVTRDMDMLDT